jgi:hypothetical protein
MSEKNPRWGTTLDEFLGEDGIREAAKAEAVTRVVVWQLTQEMERQGMATAALRSRSESRYTVHQLLYPASKG